MLTGTGIGAAKTSSQRIEAVIKSLRPPAGERSKRVLAFLHTVKNKTVTVIIFFEDILFFVVSALFFTVFLFQVNFGQLRLYIYLGAAAGFFLYYCTAAKISAALSGLAVSLVRLVLFFTFYKIAKPVFSIIAKAISVPVDAYTVRSVITSNDREAAKLFVMSEKGFGFDKIIACPKGCGSSKRSSERSADNEAGNKARNKKIKLSG